MFDYPVTFPTDEPVTFEVTCRTGPQGPKTHHPVTLNPDWSIDTGHDLGLERIAGALSGATTSCVTLADKTVPALRDTWAQAARLAPVAITPLDRGKAWAVTEPVPGCPCEKRRPWELPVAGAHIRDVTHWARRHGAPPNDARRLWAILTNPPDPTAPTYHDVFGPGLQESPPLMDHVTVNPREADALWTMGINPAWALMVQDAVGCPEPLHIAAYYYVSARQIDLDWLAAFAPYGAEMVDWAARAYSPLDAERPGARLAWLKAGFGQWVIEPLLRGPYQPDDALRLARRQETTPNLVAGYLARWLEIKAAPPIRDLCAVWSLPCALRTPPTATMLAAARRRLGPDGDRLDTTQLALIVVACGSVTAGVARLRRDGVDTPASVVIDELRAEAAEA
ncbi:MAG: hypothetical protein FWC46_05225 [Actinomycetia bacterium]|nr:hypothetical protein [Actinomycetes bacterium]